MDNSLDINQLKVVDIYFDNIVFRQKRLPRINIKLNVKY